MLVLLRDELDYTNSIERVTRCPVEFCIHASEGLHEESSVGVFVAFGKLCDVEKSESSNDQRSTHSSGTPSTQSSEPSEYVTAPA